MNAYRRHQWIFGFAGAMVACRAPAAPPADFRISSQAVASGIPEEILGWFASRHCLLDGEASEVRLSIRVERGGIDILFADSDHERGEVELRMSEREGQRVLYGTYEIGKAEWMVDGYVAVQGPWVAPSTERRHKDASQLVPVGRQFTLTEEAGGLILNLAPTMNAGAHSKRGSFECLMDRVPVSRVAQHEEQLSQLTSPRTCKVATSCCRALRSIDSGNNDDGSNDVCNSVVGLEPAFCRGWLKSAIAHYQTGPRITCIPRGSGERVCSFVDPPLHKRAIPAECIDHRSER